MGSEQGGLRVVLDTNTVLSALLFESGHLAWIRDSWVAGRFFPLCSSSTTEELIRVLAYPKFAFEEEDVLTLIGSYVGSAEVIRVANDELDGLPRCRDPKDQMFLELAVCGNADVLMTGDGDLLALADSYEFAIETPAQFKTRCGE